MATKSRRFCPIADRAGQAGRAQARDGSVKRVLVFLGMLGLFGVPGAPVLAQQATGESCARIEAEVKRLLCYDLIFRTVKPAAVTSEGIIPAEPEDEEPLSEEDAMAWPLTSTPLPNGKGMAVSITAISPEPITDSDQFAKLSVNCVNNATSVTFWFPGYFMSSDADGRLLKAQVDGAETQSLATTGIDSMMNVSSNAVAIPFAKALMAGNTVVVTATPSSGSAVKASFDLKGLTQAIRPIRQACGW